MTRVPVLVMLAALLSLVLPGIARAQHLVVGLRVGGPPPPVRVERPPVAPSPRHVWVAHQPQPPVEPNVATAPPPAPLTELQPPAPFDGAFWVPGYWWWGPSGYVWVGGRWSARPRGWDWDDHRWIQRDPGDWERRPGHWHPHEGR